MSARINLLKFNLASVLVMACAVSAPAADDTRPDCPAPTRQMREQMATWHEQMAACLRSDRAITECRAELARNHAQMMRKMGCPIAKMHPHMEHPQTPPQR